MDKSFGSARFVRELIDGGEWRLVEAVDSLAVLHARRREDPPVDPPRARRRSGCARDHAGWGARTELGHTVSTSPSTICRPLCRLSARLLYPELAGWRLRRRARSGLDVVDASTGDAWAVGRVWRGRGGDRCSSPARTGWSTATGRRRSPRRRRAAPDYGGEAGSTTAAFGCARWPPRCGSRTRARSRTAMTSSTRSKRIGVARERSDVRRRASGEFLRRPLSRPGAGSCASPTSAATRSARGALSGDALGRILGERERGDPRRDTGAPGRVLADLPRRSTPGSTSCPSTATRTCPRSSPVITCWSPPRSPRASASRCRRRWPAGSRRSRRPSPVRAK